MSNDLISRSELIKDLMEQIPLAENVPIFKDIIENQPTAYDPDKVVQQLENNSYMTDNTYDEEGFSNDDAVEVINLSDAIRTVKGGGVE